MKAVTNTLTSTERAMTQHEAVAMAQTRILGQHETRFERMDGEEKKTVVIIEGISENTNETLVGTAKLLFQDIGVNWGIEQVEYMERIGTVSQRQNVNNQDGRPHREPRPRPVKMVFYKKSIKPDMMKSLKNLKGKVQWKGISIGDQLDEKERREFMDLRAMYFLARDLEFDVRLRQRSIILDKKSYTHSMLDRLPYHELTLERATTSYSEDGILFRSIHNRFSNLYPCVITKEGKDYNCVEQAFQAKKARVLGEKKTEERIMSMLCPYAMMNEGKKLKDSANWVKMAEKELYELNTIKFEEPSMKAHLQGTGDQRMYEASFHPVWGVGYHLGQADLCTHDTMRGANLHGLILERVRRDQQKAEKPEEVQEQVPDNGQVDNEDDRQQENNN